MRNFILYSVCLLFFLSCENFSDDDFESHNINLHIVLPQEIIDTTNIAGQISVSLTNTRKGYTIAAKTDSTGHVRLNEVESGIYLINISEHFEFEKYSLILNGSSELLINGSTNDSITLSHSVVQKDGGNFIIREYYYSACLTPNKKQYINDQYVEIYNNSPDTLYADSLLLVEHESYATSPNFFAPIQADSIVTKAMWALPQGKRHPIAPGKGFIIAQDAMNHKSDPNGNRLSPVDMGDAEFEFWSDKVASTGDVDFPAENMVNKLWVYKGTEYVFHTRGGSAIAIVKIPGDVDEYVKNNLAPKGTASGDTKYYCKIPNKWVIDAVEATWNSGMQQGYKRFDNSIDAGITFVKAGARSGLCVRRKIDYKIDYKIGSRTVYQDTNNSSVDFLTDQIPQPRNYE